MSKLAELIKALLPGLRSRSEMDDSYLAGANDVYDLERRMRELDIRSRDASRGLIWSYRAW